MESVCWTRLTERHTARWSTLYLLLCLNGSICNDDLKKCKVQQKSVMQVRLEQKWEMNLCKQSAHVEEVKRLELVSREYVTLKLRPQGLAIYLKSEQRRAMTISYKEYRPYKVSCRTKERTLQPDNSLTSLYPLTWHDVMTLETVASVHLL